MPGEAAPVHTLGSSPSCAISKNSWKTGAQRPVGPVARCAHWWALPHTPCSPCPVPAVAAAPWDWRGAHPHLSAVEPGCRRPPWCPCGTQHHTCHFSAAEHLPCAPNEQERKAQRGQPLPGDHTARRRWRKGQNRSDGFLSSRPLVLSVSQWQSSPKMLPDLSRESTDPVGTFPSSSLCCVIHFPR